MRIPKKVNEDAGPSVLCAAMGMLACLRVAVTNAAPVPASGVPGAPIYMPGCHLLQWP